MGEPSRARIALRALLVFAGCFCGALLFARLNFPAIRGALLFPPYAVLTAAMLVSPPRTWWVFMLASAAGNFLPHLETGPSSFVALAEVANFTRALVAAFIIHRFARPSEPFDTLRSSAIFLIGVVIVAPAVGAAIGASVVVFFRDQPYLTVFRAWFFSNALSAVTLLVPFWLIAAKSTAWQLPHRRTEALALAAGVLASSALAFELLPVLPSGLILPMPFLVWAAVRFGPAGFSASFTCVTALVLAGALSGHSPFLGASPAENLLHLQLFLLCVAVPMLLVSSLIGDLGRASSALTAARAQYDTAVKEQASAREQYRAALQAQAEAAARYEVAMQGEAAARDDERRKDEFLAMLGHELRNPLAPIGVALELLETADPRRLDSARRVIVRQVHQMERLVGDIVDVSRITRGQLRLQRARLDLGALAEQAIETVRPLLDTRRHRLTVSLPEGPLLIEADGDRLTQVMVNLLNNAAKYTEPGGRIAIIVAADGDHAVISVQDNGIGIAGEMQERVFELFDRGERGTELAVEGLGVGLTLARRLVALHGGTLTAQSKGKGLGSEFVVRLPLVAPAGLERPVPRPPPTPPVPRAMAAALEVLVIDDNLDSAEMLGELVELWGYSVRIAHAGAQALELVRASPPDVVLSDVGLPDLSGLELARILRSEPAMSNALLVAITGHDGLTDRLRSVEAGFNHHLVKPIDVRALETMLAETAQGRHSSLATH